MIKKEGLPLLSARNALPSCSACLVDSLEQLRVPQLSLWIGCEEACLIRIIPVAKKKKDGEQCEWSGYQCELTR
jgi:hypothetical protein